MNDPKNSKRSEHPLLIGGRYRVLEILGQGGMAVVYRVTDTHTGNLLALKQMYRKKQSRSRAEIAELLEHEYHTLSQLVHPCVIEVYNYGKDDKNPYYTMEILEGGSLHDLSPLPFKQACSIIIDICSALGLLHSRRRVHRDVSPRNIHCTKEMKAKLIDFGAMMSMGTCKRVIGTPAYTSPEMLGLQSMDARSDLYSLGATLYYALTGHNAYRAKNFSDLRDLWRSSPPTPSFFVPEIPKELDDLVMSMIQLDPVARPVNTAEVMDKLSAIAGIELDDHFLFSKACLSTPMLVGHKDLLVKIRKRVVGVLGGKGTSILIEADAGMGRSRFLDACVLEGQIAGLTALRADASDAYAGSWGAVREIASQLLDALPKPAVTTSEPYISVLGHVLPELLDRYEDKQFCELKSTRTYEKNLLSNTDESSSCRSAEVWGKALSSRPPVSKRNSSIILENFDNSQQLRPKVQVALREWMLKLGREHCLMIAIDDIHRIDEPSAAFISLLAQNLSSTKIIVVIAVKTDAEFGLSEPIKLLKESSRRIVLQALDLNQTEKLLGSIFGEADNLRLLADRLYTASQGNPRSIMDFAQYLVDKSVICFRGGTWTLPDKIDTHDLPDSLLDALSSRLNKISSGALNLAQAMALSPQQSFSYEECLLLIGHRETGSLIRNLDELSAIDMVSTDGEKTSLSRPGWIPVLSESIDRDDRCTFHLRLAEMFEKRGTEHFRVAQHLLSAGQEERAVDAFIEFSEISQRVTTKDPDAYADLLQSLPIDWLATLSAAIDLAKKMGRPRKEIYTIQSRLSGLVGVTGTTDTSHLTDMQRQLLADTGLYICHELADTVEKKDRLVRSLQLAQQRYDSASELERVLAPTDAIRELSRALVQACGVVYSSHDLSFWRSLPSLGPLVALSPALGVVDKTVQATGCSIKGHIEQNRRLCLETLNRIDQPDRAGLEETYYKYTRYAMVHSVGIVEASMGLESSLGHASEVEKSPILQVNAWRIRMLYYLWQGDQREAERCRYQTELLKIQNSPVQSYQGTHLCSELLSYCLADDLNGIKRVTDEIREMADRFPAWVPVLHYAQGEYQRVRGDYPSALEQLRTALDLIEPAKYMCWADLAGAMVKTLVALDRVQEARDMGQRFLEIAEGEKLGYLCNYIKLPLALAEATLGNRVRALALSEAVVQSFKTLGSSGLNPALAFENRARIAIICHDPMAFDTYSQLCRRQYKTGFYPALSAKYEKLIQEAVKAELTYSEVVAYSVNSTDFGTTMTSGEIVSMLEAVQELTDRAQQALALLVQKCNCLGGYLYTMQTKGPEVTAQIGDSILMSQDEMDSLVKDYIESEVGGIRDETYSVDQQEEASSTSSSNWTLDRSNWTFHRNDVYRPILLGHYTKGGFSISGLAVLRTNPNRSFQYPTEIISTISKVLVDMGGVSPVYAAH